MLKNNWGWNITSFFRLLPMIGMLQKIKAVVVRLIPILLIFYAIWNPEAQPSEVFIYDEADLFGQQEEAELEAQLLKIGQEEHYSYILVTKNTCEETRLPLEGDEALLRPDSRRSWLWRTFMPSTRNHVAIHYCINSNLIQIRYGRDIRAKARLAGIDYGTGYKAIQSLATSTSGNPDFINIANEITANLKMAENTSRLKVFAVQLLMLVGDDIVPFLFIPHFEYWSGVSSWFAIPVVEWLAARIPFPFFLVLAVACLIPFVRILFLIPVYLIALVSIVFEFERFFLFSILLGVLASYLGVFIGALPMAGVLMVYASGRLEDVMMLESVGGKALASLPGFPVDMAWYWVLLMALGVMILLYVRERANDFNSFRSAYQERVARWDGHFKGDMQAKFEVQEYEKALKEYKASKPKQRLKSIWKGLMGGLLVLLLPVWAALIFAGFALAYELVPIRFGSRE